MKYNVTVNLSYTLYSIHYKKITIQYTLYSKQIRSYNLTATKRSPQQQSVVDASNSYRLVMTI